jgi:excisionase family DNA binding protein
LTVPETAARLRVSRQTVYRAIAAGRLPAVQLGGPGAPLRVDERELEAWLYQLPAERDGPQKPIHSLGADHFAEAVEPSPPAGPEAA